MGNCFGSPVRKREDAWKATGLVTLRDAQLRAIPKGVLAAAPLVKTLDFTGNVIAELPEGDEMSGFTQLQRLALSGNRLGGLPASVGRLPALRALALDGNRLSLLPPQLGQLGRLETLLLQGNTLHALPPELGCLSALRVLNVAGNALKALPAELGACSALQVCWSDHPRPPPQHAGVA